MYSPLHSKRVYYRMMGWDENTGIPTVGKLEELDIRWVADSEDIVDLEQSQPPCPISIEGTAYERN